MKHLIMLLFFGLLFGQDVQTETDKEITKQEQREMRQNLAQEKMNKLSWGQKMWMGAQDAEWRKFEAAHRRAHSKRGEAQTYIRESKKHNWKRTVSYIVVGGLGYYIGTLEQDKKHRGMKRPGWKRPEKK